MAVVINEFEALSEPGPEAGQGAGERAAEAAPAQEKIEPCAVASALRTLAEQALRAWAH
jgi:hypothetical protein